MQKIIEWIIPAKTVSPNAAMHWTRKHKLHKTQKLLVHLAFVQLDEAIDLPLHIVLKRFGKRFLDREDNLPMSFKAIKDQIACELIPGLAPGQADGDPRLSWSYDQDKGKDTVSISLFRPE